MTRFPLVFRVCFVFALPLLAVVACDDDSTEPPVESFSLEVEVTEPDGTPVEGLKIVVWNTSDRLERFIQDVWPKRASTVVNFDLPESSECWFTTHDLEGGLVQTLLDGDTLPAGVHALALGRDVAYTAGVEVQSYRLRATAVSGELEPFEDERLMTIVHLDIERIEGGFTGADGRYSTHDRTMVPGLYDLGEMAAVNENGEAIGSFTLGNELRIVAFDDQGNSIGIDHVAEDAANTVKIEWDLRKTTKPVDALGFGAEGIGSDAETSGPTALRSADVVPGPDLEYRLYQNYPNPYN